MKELVSDQRTSSAHRCLRNPYRPTIPSWTPPPPEATLYCCYADDEFFKADYGAGESYNVCLPEARADFRTFFLYPAESEQFEWFSRTLALAFQGGGFRGKVDAGEDGNEMDWRKTPPDSPLIGKLSESFMQI